MSLVSTSIWPTPESLDMEIVQKADVITAIFYRPFHYILGFLFLVLTIYSVVTIVKKVMYEWKVAALFKRLPYEATALFLIVLLIYLKMAFFFTYMTIFLSLLLISYEIIAYVPKQKEKVIFVKE
jgi:hypothetical protein